MRIHKYLTAILLSAVITSCDPIYSSEIKNKTNDNLLIEVQFDQIRMNEIWGGRPIIPYLRGHAMNEGVDMVEFDTINFKTIYQVKNSFIVEHGMSRPDYEIYESIKIISKSDTIYLNGKSEIAKAGVLLAWMTLSQRLK